MEEVKKLSYKYCIVPKCTNTTRKTPDKVFFRISSDAKIRKQWCKVMRRDNISPKSCLYCCEDHFNVKEDTENYIEYNLMKEQGEKCTLRLKKGVLPHIFLCQKRRMPLPKERMAVVKMQRLTLVNEALSSEIAIKSSVSEPSQRSDHEVSPSTSHTNVCDQPGCSTSRIGCDDLQVELSTSHIEKTLHCDKAVQVNIKPNYRSKGVNVNIPTKKQNVALSPFPFVTQNIGTSPVKLSVLKRKLFTENTADTISISSYFSMSSTDYEPSYQSESSEVLSDSEKEKQFKYEMCSIMLTAIEKEPKMLLGLPKQSYHLIKLLSDNIPLPSKHILITLKKIKLNESFSILALQFGCSQSTICRIFSRSISLIAAKLKDLIVWPASSDIYNNLPISFRRRYGNVVSIIDCLEIQIEKPSNAVHQSLTWSQYKKCNTLKYLISCTPDGLINFISDGYGGRATDVMIVQDSSYLQALPPNKAVMADRGFKDLSCLLEAKRCTLIRPPSVSKSTPSTKNEVKLSKRIAALRIHVERVINRLREFHMLLPHACVDYNLIPIIDDVIIVACGLVNMQDVLIKK
ncbi:hypothetical protein HW555_009699 [Spodoptera exigua]|uniref:THAP-type domain-containing protein n=1 Tax=Spodoptera exigua TaxID=7107 RepID=A0A835L0J1_SPOEX|nr:hypothetical protein HW555_009699 [Spodoptera exigua]